METSPPEPCGDTHTSAVGDVLFLAAYASALITAVATVTGTAILLASATHGLGQLVLVAAGWLVVVCASPAFAERGAKRLVSIGRHTPSSIRSTAPVRFSPPVRSASRDGYLGTDDEGTP